MDKSSLLTEAMIRETIQKYVTFSIAGDAKAITMLFLDKGIVSDGSHIYAGRMQLLAMFSHEMRQRRPDFQLDTEIMQINFSADGRSAVVHERFSVVNGDMTVNGISIMQFVLWCGKVRIAAEIVHEGVTVERSDIEAWIT